MIGATVSHYKILEKLGEGGMGVVYKATDTELDRPVALKFLPSDLTASDEERARFVREAKAVSSLDHPNICTVHEAGRTDDGQMFIVMAYYEGDPLNKIIARGRLSIEESLRIAIQVAEGLAAAHSKGIVHRDVKPGNIIVTREEQVKLVDFGLASQIGRTRLTKSHSTIGTAAYMAPEQATGEGADHRSDLWSLGVVLYEMLTGKLPFRGEHEAAVMYSIVNEQPQPIEEQLNDIPPDLPHVIRRMLEKDPSDRYQSAADVLIELRRLKRDTTRSKYSSATVPGTVRKVERRRRFLWGSAATIAITALVAVFAYFFIADSPKLPRLNPDRKVTILPLPTSALNYSRLSHDGKWIAFAGRDDSGTWDVYIMNSGGGAIRRITNDSTRLAGVSDFSPDGSMVVYYRRDRITRTEVVLVPILGGEPRILAKGLGAKFTHDGKSLLYGSFPEKVGQLWSINLDGSNDRFVYEDTLLRYGFGSHSPAPDRYSFASIRNFADYTFDIVTVDPGARTERQITFSQTAKDEIFWTNHAFIIYSSFANGNFDLWMVSEDGGNPQQLTVSRHDEVQAQLSDDGKKLLYFERQTAGNIRKLDLRSGETSSVTDDDIPRAGLSVSRDGRYFAFETRGRGFYDRMLTGIDRMHERPQWTIAESNDVLEHAWSPNGAQIAFRTNPDSMGGPTPLHVMLTSGGEKPRILLKGRKTQGLEWVDDTTLTWFEGMKTWVCSINDPEPRQFFEDSTAALPIQGWRSILYRDLRHGRTGVWLTAPGASPSTARRILPGGVFLRALRIEPEFFVVLTRDRRILKIWYEDARKEVLTEHVPDRLSYTVLSPDLKTLYGLERTNSQKLILWEDPFIWD